MTNPTKTIEIKVERTIPGQPEEVFDAWLDPKVPGTPWSEADKLILNPTVDGLFYWLIRENAHYGRFTEVARPRRLEHTWMSPSTLGRETKVMVTFIKQEQGTLMTLVHSNLPDTEGGRGHEKGWKYFVGNFAERYSSQVGLRPDLSIVEGRG